MEVEQIRVFSLLSDYDEVSNSQIQSDHVLTAIVSTLIDNSTENGVDSAVFILRGIWLPLEQNNLSRLEVRDDYPGWMATPRWIVSKKFSSELTTKWREAAEVEECASLLFGQKQFCSVDIDTLEREESHVHVPNFSSGPNMVSLTRGHAELLSSVEKFSLRVSHCQRAEAVAAAGAASSEYGMYSEYAAHDVDEVGMKMALYFFLII